MYYSFIYSHYLLVYYSFYSHYLLVYVIFYFLISKLLNKFNFPLFTLILLIVHFIAVHLSFCLFHVVYLSYLFILPPTAIHLFN